MKDIKSAGDERASPEGFITLHGFMMKGMGLSGVPLLVFARIYGFNSAGLDFYESKPHLASFLNTTERSVYRAFSDLLEKGLIQESGSHRHASGAETMFFTTTIFRISRLISFGFHRFAKAPHPFFANCPTFPS